MANRRRLGLALLKEQLRIVFHEPDTAAAIALLDTWLAWARRCRIASRGRAESGPERASVGSGSRRITVAGPYAQSALAFSK